jgi:hypothetical protein
MAEHEVIVMTGDLRRCICGQPVGVHAGKLSHVTEEQAAADRADANIRFHARVGPEGIRVTVEGVGDAEPELPVSDPLDGQTGRQKASIG